MIGSLASGSQSGTSDIDLLLRLEMLPANPIEGVKPFYDFFSRCIEMALDILLGSSGGEAAEERRLAGSLLLAGRERSGL